MTGVAAVAPGARDRVRAEAGPAAARAGRWGSTASTGRSIPLQAANAHFNLRRLGAVVEHYEVNVYGELVNPLHGGLPTDRFVAQWWLDSPDGSRP